MWLKLEIRMILEMMIFERQLGLWFLLICAYKT